MHLATLHTYLFVGVIYGATLHPYLFVGVIYGAEVELFFSDTKHSAFPVRRKLTFTVALAHIVRALYISRGA